MPYIVDELLMAKVFAQNGFRFVVCVFSFECIEVEVRTVNEISSGRWMAGIGFAWMEQQRTMLLLLISYTACSVCAFGNRNFGSVNDRATNEWMPFAGGRYLLFCHPASISAFSADTMAMPCYGKMTTGLVVYYNPDRGVFEGRLRVSWRLIDSVLGRD